MEFRLDNNLFMTTIRLSTLDRHPHVRLPEYKPVGPAVRSRRDLRWSATNNSRAFLCLNQGYPVLSHPDSVALCVSRRHQKTLAHRSGCPMPSPRSTTSRYWFLRTKRSDRRPNPLLLFSTRPQNSKTGRE